MRNVKIGETYKLKVGVNAVDVKIARSIAGGWEAISIKSGKTITIKNAKRLSATKKSAPSKTKAVVKKPDVKKKPAAKAAAKPRAPKAKAPVAKNDKKMSLLDAAAFVLSVGPDDHSSDRMGCRQIVELAAKRNLWKPGKGLTPERTLYSAILREITTKGAESRFVKAERGMFALA